MMQYVNLLLLDFMVGPHCSDVGIRTEKLRHLKEGLYDDLMVNIEIPMDFGENKFSSIEEYLAHLTSAGKRCVRRLTEGR